MLTQTLLQLRTAARRLADAEGADALARHPDADVNDYVNRGLASLHRKLVRTCGHERYLTRGTFNTVAGTSDYSITTNLTTLMHIVSVDITADGSKRWLDAFALNEYPMLTDTNANYPGMPFVYAVRGDNFTLLPAPDGIYPVNVWYVPHVVAMSSDSDNFDTIDRLDEYVAMYAAKFMALKDNQADRLALLKGEMADIMRDIEAIAPARDQNSVSRIVDESLAAGSGRPYPWSRRVMR